MDKKTTHRRIRKCSLIAGGCFGIAGIAWLASGTMWPGILYVAIAAAQFVLASIHDRLRNTDNTED